MKQLIIIVTVLTVFSCKAQGPIVSLDAKRHETPDGAYFKDINSELNKFEGTWLFTNGSNSLTLIIQKREMVYNNIDYRDVIIGEYRYIENGVEIINTLSNINNSNPAKHRLSGSLIIPTNMFVACDDCNLNERRIMLDFSDPERNFLSASIILRYLSDGDPFGQNAQMTATIISDGGGIIPNENSPTELRVPYGEYLMTKE